MAIKPQTSFSGGELDSLLHDRVTLERFQNGVHTGRNVMIGKTGSILSRFSTFLFIKAKYDNGPIKIFYPQNSGFLLEFGCDPNNMDDVTFTGNYVRLYDTLGNMIHEYVTDTTPPALLDQKRLYFDPNLVEKLQFEYSGNYVYVFQGDNDSVYARPLRIELASPWSVYVSTQLFPARGFSTAPTATYTSSATGYDVEFAISLVSDGQEGALSTLVFSPLANKPIAAGEKTDIDITIQAAVAIPSNYQEIRVYQRPAGGAAYGYIGKTNNFALSGGNLHAYFTDVGADPDFGQNGIVDIVKDTLDSSISASLVSAGTGVIYQQRLILGNIIGINDEAILASRPGYQTNFYRDYPYSSISALNFKAGASGKAKVLRMIEQNGLVVFTSVGVFVNTGVLSPDNVVLDKRGPWVIDENVPPLIIPDGMFFVEKKTGRIKQLVYSSELSTYTSLDQTVFSSHLFKNRTIKSWAFQDGVAPLVIIVFSDGEIAMFTYNYEQQMKAWTRGDSVYPIEQVEGTDEPDLSFWVVNKNGNRYIDGTVARYIAPEDYVANPEAAITAYGAFMDSLKVKRTLLNDSLVGTDTFVLTPVVADDWEGELTLTCGTSGLFLVAGNGVVGTIFRFFDPVDKNAIDLTITARASDNSVTVQPSEEFPLAYASGFRMYLTHLTMTGLDHLEGEEVSVMCDGNIISSPFNDNESDSFTTLTVSAGAITLPERSAITTVGRPIVADIKTLNVNTAEQSPTVLESMTCSKVYVKTHESRGLFVSNEYPEEVDGEVDGTSVAGMQTLDNYYIENSAPIIGNRRKQPSTKRHEVITSGKYLDNSQISLRQVDPLHFEITSIIADIDILPRRN